MMTTSVAELRDLVERATRILCFTGAGISTGSLIPDFRGPRGVWRTRQPVYYADFVASEQARIEYWEFKLDGYSAFRDALPNRAHLALVALERRGKLLSLVTQNVDGLHRAAGTSRDKLIELHGTNAEAECLGCTRRSPIDGCLADFERTRVPPRCSECGEPMKPAVIMFGQSLVAENVRAALAAAVETDLVLALGSTLTVTPAADVPLTAAHRGVPYVIVNQGQTAHDTIADHKIDADVCELLPELLEAKNA